MSKWVAGFTLVLLWGLRPSLASAVPGFSRQTDRPCSSCHVTWPGQLRKMGRVFKFAGYTDVAPDYRAENTKAKRLDLLQVLPVSARLAAAPYVSGPGEPEGSNSRVDRLSLFLSGKVADGIGAYSEWSYEGQVVVPAARLVMQGPSSRNVETGLVMGRMEPGGADPFNTIRHNAGITRSIGPALTEGEFATASTRNFGVVAHAYLFDEIYVAAGPFRGDSAWDMADQGIDLFARAAVDHLVDWGDETGLGLGAFVYAGRELDRMTPAGDETIPVSPVTYDTSVRRWGVDTQFQYFSGIHSVQVTALTIWGRDGLAAGTAPASFNGFNAQLLYVSGWQHGILLKWDSISTRPDPERGRKMLGFGPVFFPWENVKVGLEWRQQIRTGRAGGVPIIERPHQHSPPRLSSHESLPDAGAVVPETAAAPNPGRRTGLAFVIDVAF